MIFTNKNLHELLVIIFNNDEIQKEFFKLQLVHTLNDVLLAQAIIATKGDFIRAHTLLELHMSLHQMVSPYSIEEAIIEDVNWYDGDINDYDIEHLDVRYIKDKIG